MTAELVHIEVLRACRAGILQRGLPALRKGEEADVPAKVADALVAQGYARLKAIDHPLEDKMQKHPVAKKGL